MQVRIKIRKWNRLILAAAAAVGVLFLESAAPAKQVRAAGRYSLTVGISVNVTDWANHTSVAEPVSGAVIRIDRVADLDVATGEYTETGAFRTVGVDYQNFDTEASIEAAPQYAAITQQLGVTGQTRTTGSNGRVTFENLDPGMYLIQESDRTGDAKKYQTIDPYLLSVPEISMDSNGNVTVTAADVESYPKTAPEAETPGTPENPGTPTTPNMPETTTPTSLPKGNSPKTGEFDVDPMGFVEAGLAVAAVLLVRKQGGKKSRAARGGKNAWNAKIAGWNGDSKRITESETSGQSGEAKRSRSVRDGEHKRIKSRKRKIHNIIKRETQAGLLDDGGCRSSQKTKQYYRDRGFEQPGVIRQQYFIRN